MRNLAISLIVATLLSACTKAGDENPTVTFKNYSYDCMAQYMEEENDSTSVQPMHLMSDCMMPERIGRRDITSLRDSLAVLADMDISGKHPTALLPDGFKFSSKTPVPEYDSYQASSVSVTLLTSRVIVWTASSAIYFHGAAHGMYATNYLNYDIRADKIITLDQLMNKGYEKPLLSLIKERLAGRDDIIADSDDIPLPPQFCILPDGMRFLYGLYEVAPYSSGEISVDFSTYELGDILRDEAVEMILTGKPD